ncbi:MAG: hypothetical protein DME28_03000 [Verrucomicrobia bacterium]|nr:MAG: hypothetical protein DME28_03000 [Verrucomicrobiota bacterium]
MTSEFISRGFGVSPNKGLLGFASEDLQILACRFQHQDFVDLTGRMFGLYRSGNITRTRFP